MGKTKISSTTLPNTSENGPRSTKVADPEAAKSPIAREILMNISSADWGETCDSRTEGTHERGYTNHLWVSSQFDRDLASAAEYEYAEVLQPDDLENGFFDFNRSPMYWKLRQTFVEEAEVGNVDSFMKLVWRSYNAGRLSPARLTPEHIAERENYVLTRDTV